MQQVLLGIVLSHGDDEPRALRCFGVGQECMLESHIHRCVSAGLFRVLVLIVSRGLSRSDPNISTAVSEGVYHLTFWGFYVPLYSSDFRSKIGVFISDWNSPETTKTAGATMSLVQLFSIVWDTEHTYQHSYRTKLWMTDYRGQTMKVHQDYRMEM